MSSVRIVADSGCDLPPDTVRQYEITVVPVYIQFGDHTVTDAELGLEGFWRRARTLSTAPGTAAPPPGVFANAYRKLVAAGHDVICLTLPGNHSATYNSAWLGAQEFGQRVRIFDSGSITLGMGYQVVAAARAALAGHSADAIQGMLEALRRRTSVIFVLDTLEWVRRGGRLERILPLVDRLARTFRVKPIVEMENGEMRLLGVSRSQRNALARIEEEVRARLPVDTVAAAYTRGCEVAAELADRLAPLLGIPPGEVVLQEAGPVFATHAGPNAYGAVIIRS